MCGIVGTLGCGDTDSLRRMANALVHRGPDAEGFFEDPASGIYLGSRRLSVIDPEGGHQPVRSEDGSVVAVFNGEIYNAGALRADLEGRGHTFRSLTDTEVLPHLYEEYGEEFPLHLDGMFAIALWDANARKLLLVRDPMGIKPLYVWQSGTQLAFASEAKAFMQLDAFEAALDLDALHFLLNVRFIPGRRTLFDGVRKLLPGTVLVGHEGRFQSRRYWELTARPDRSIRRPQDAAGEVRRLLGRAVEKQLVSDVPLGLYLSGGIDSSSLVALASRASDSAVNTFSLGFNEPTDELADARVVASAFGTRHREETISFDALSVFPQVVWHVEEPKENAIQLHVLAAFAAKHVTVALSGLGGDELFGGYRIFDYLRPTLPLQRVTSRRAHDAVLRPAGELLRLLTGHLGSMRFDLAKRGLDYACSMGAPARSYLLLRNMWEHDRRLFRSIYTPQAQVKIERGVEAFFAPLFGRSGDLREDVLRAELAYKLVDDFLLNEDRTSMASSLEVRVPFLDVDLVTFASSIPADVKFQGGLKAVLRLAMRDLLPGHTLRKPKWGFTFDSYLQFQKDLRRLARAELTRAFIGQQGIFEYGFIQRILDHPPHRWMRWHYFLLWLILGVKVWEDLFLRGLRPEECWRAP